MDEEGGMKERGKNTHTEKERVKCERVYKKKTESLNKS